MVPDRGSMNCEPRPRRAANHAGRRWPGCSIFFPGFPYHPVSHSLDVILGWSVGCNNAAPARERSGYLDSLGSVWRRRLTKNDRPTIAVQGFRIIRFTILLLTRFFCSSRIIAIGDILQRYACMYGVPDVLMYSVCTYLGTYPDTVWYLGMESCKSGGRS